MISQQVEKGLYKTAVALPVGFILANVTETMLVYDAHTSRKPEIENSITQDYPTEIQEVETFWGYRFKTVPTLRFELTSQERDYAGQGKLTLGMHHFGQDEIYIASGVIPSLEDSLLEKIELWFVDSLEPKTVLRHELTHSLVDQIGDGVNCGIGSGEKRDHIIQEGIATYAEIALGSTQREIHCQNPLPETIEELGDYNDGYCFVKTLLDLNRIQGMVYLLCRPASEKDILQPEKYYADFRRDNEMRQ